MASAAASRGACLVIPARADPRAVSATGGVIRQQEFPNLNHVARGLGLGVTPLESVGRT